MALKIKQIIFKLEIRYILIDLNYISKMKPSEFKFSISVESYGDKTTENYQNYFVAK